jgi:hypothetical protein
MQTQYLGCSRRDLLETVAKFLEAPLGVGQQCLALGAKAHVSAAPLEEGHPQRFL